MYEDIIIIIIFLYILYYFTLIRMIISRFVGIGNRLNRYSNGHTKYNQLKTFRDYF
jgi:hypothetical protein